MNSQQQQPYAWQQPQYQQQPAPYRPPQQVVTKKSLSGAEQNHRADIAIVVDGGEDLKQRVAHRHVVGVELIGTIQRDPRDRAALGIQNRWRAVNRHQLGPQLECRSALSLLAIAGRPRS